MDLMDIMVVVLCAEGVLSALIIAMIIVTAVKLGKRLQELEGANAEPIAEVEQYGTVTALLPAPKTRRLTHKESYDALTDEQRALYDELVTYALAKEGMQSTVTKRNETVGAKRKIVLELQIKRKAAAALFPFVNNVLKQYQKTLLGADRNVRIKKTEIVLTDEQDLAAAKDMVDLMYSQLKREKEAAKEKRRKHKSEPAIDPAGYVISEVSKVTEAAAADTESDDNVEPEVEIIKPDTVA